MSKYSNENLAQPPYQEFEILSGTGQQGIFNVHFPNYLYVVYTRKTDDTYNRDLYRPLNMSNYETTVVTNLSRDSFFDIDMNGIVIDNSPLYEGTWARSRLSDLLPVDYVPDQK